MNSIFSEIPRAFTYLFIAGIVFVAWNLSKEAVAKGKSLRRTLLIGLGWCLVIALFSSFTLGTHTENCDDPVYGTCDRIQDYEPTTMQRVANITYFITLLYIPVVIGAYSGKKTKETSKLL